MSRKQTIILLRQETGRIIQDFSEYEKRNWLEVEDILHSSNLGLLQALEKISAEQLESDEFLEGSEGRPAWRNLSGVMLGHPVLHICEYLVQQGDAEQGMRIMLDFTEKGRALDDGDVWQGLQSYNQACYFALAGYKPQAQEKLAEALRLNPGLEEWSKQDADLASLRV